MDKFTGIAHTFSLLTARMSLVIAIYAVLGASAQAGQISSFDVLPQLNSPLKGRITVSDIRNEDFYVQLASAEDYKKFGLTRPDFLRTARITEGRSGPQSAYVSSSDPVKQNEFVVLFKLIDGNEIRFQPYKILLRGDSQSSVTPLPSRLAAATPMAEGAGETKINETPIPKSELPKKSLASVATKPEPAQKVTKPLVAPASAPTKPESPEIKTQASNAKPAKVANAAVPVLKPKLPTPEAKAVATLPSSAAPAPTVPPTPLAISNTAPSHMPSTDLSYQAPGQALQQVYPNAMPGTPVVDAFPGAMGQTSMATQGPTGGADNTLTITILIGFGLTLVLIMAAFALILWRTRGRHDMSTLVATELSGAKATARARMHAPASPGMHGSSEHVSSVRQAYRTEPQLDLNDAQISGTVRSSEFKQTNNSDLSALMEVTQKLHTIQDAQLQADHLLKKAQLNAQNNQVLIQALEQLTRQQNSNKKDDLVINPAHRSPHTATNSAPEFISQPPAPTANTPVAVAPVAASPLPTQDKTTTQSANIAAEGSVPSPTPQASEQTSVAQGKPAESVRLPVDDAPQPTPITTIRHSGLGFNTTPNVRAGQAPIAGAQRTALSASELRGEINRPKNKPLLRTALDKSQENYDLAVVYLNMGDRGTAEILLRELETTGHPEIVQKATTLLSQLKSH